MTNPDNYYRIIAERLRNLMESENITIEHIKKMSGQQANTVKGVLKGKRFQAHQVVWLSKLIDIHVSDDDMEIHTEEGDSNEQRDEEIKEEINLADFI